MWRDLYSLGCLLVASGKLAPSLPPPAASSLPARDEATALHGALRGGQCAAVTCLEAGTDSPEIVGPARCGPAAAEEPAAVSAGVSTADFSSEAAEQPAAVNAGMSMAHCSPETAEGPAASAQGQAHAPLAAVTCQEPAAAAATAAGEQAGGCSAAPRAPQLGAADCPAAVPLGCSAAEAAASALHDLDLAAIMGGPLFRPEVDAAIASVQALLQQRHEPADRRAEQQSAAPGQAASTAPLSEPACGAVASSDAAASKAGSGTAAANLVPAADAGVKAADTAAAGSRCHAQSGCLGTGPAGGSRRSAQAPAPGTPTGKRHKAAAGASAGSKSFHRADVTLPPGSLGPEGVRPPVERLPSLERWAGCVAVTCLPAEARGSNQRSLARCWSVRQQRPCAASCLPTCCSGLPAGSDQGRLLRWRGDVRFGHACAVGQQDAMLGPASLLQWPPSCRSRLSFQWPGKAPTGHPCRMQVPGDLHVCPRWWPASGDNRPLARLASPGALAGP